MCSYFITGKKLHTLADYQNLKEPGLVYNIYQVLFKGL